MEELKANDGKTSLGQLNQDELMIVRDIISNWKENEKNLLQQLGGNNDRVKTSFLVKRNLLRKVEEYSERMDISKSNVLEKALEDFLNRCK